MKYLIPFLRNTPAAWYDYHFRQNSTYALQFCSLKVIINLRQSFLLDRRYYDINNEIEYLFDHIAGATDSEMFRN